MIKNVYGMIDGFDLDCFDWNLYRLCVGIAYGGVLSKFTDRDRPLVCDHDRYVRPSRCRRRWLLGP